MIISHRHRFVFLHVPKTAGTSLRDGLQNLDPACESGWEWAWSADQMRYVDRAHVTMRDLEASPRHRRLVEDYFTFAVVRHPFERFVSGVLEHMRQLELPVTGESVRALVEGLDPFRLRFDVRYIHLCPMHEFTHLGLRRRFDHLLRFEHLEEDLARMCAFAGIEADRILPLAHANASGSAERAVVDAAMEAPDLRARFEELYGLDFTLFGFAGTGEGRERLAARAQAMADLSPKARRAADAEGVFLPEVVPLADLMARANAAEARVAALEAAMEAERETRAALEATVERLEAGLAEREATAVPPLQEASPRPARRKGIVARLRRNLSRELGKAALLVRGPAD